MPAGEIQTQPWEPTATELRVAEYVAAGWTLQRSAQGAKVPMATVQKWLEFEDFRQLVTDIRADIAARQRPLFDKQIDLAQQLIVDALSGNRRADSPDVLLAERVLARTLYRLAVIGSRAGGGRNVPTEPHGLLYGGTEPT